ncbi:MAG: hypothetical protein LBG44_00990 [Gemmatimonadota bacterium]|jgi:hypothetical protein|nr:hypothetical protein [Gemmatimonadota bacterium]
MRSRTGFLLRSVTPLRAAVLLGTLLLISCADQRDGRSADGSPSTDALSPDSGGGFTPPPSTSEGRSDADPLGPTPVAWTTDSITVTSGASAVAALDEITTSINEGFDRVILEFDGDEPPAYHVEYVTTPITQCGSGNRIDVDGAAQLLVRTSPSTAQGGQSTIPRSQRPSLLVIRELILACDFEAHTEWVFGTTARNPFRVMALSKPARLVIDIRH